MTEHWLCPDTMDEAIDGYEKKAPPQGGLLIRKIEASVGPVLAKKFLTSAW